MAARLLVSLDQSLQRRARANAAGAVRQDARRAEQRQQAATALGAPSTVRTTGS